MKNILSVKWIWCPLLILSIIIFLFPNTTIAQVECQGMADDNDCDGFSNTAEVNGFTSISGTHYSNLDSTKKTLFYIYQKTGTAHTAVPQDDGKRLDYIKALHGDNDVGGLDFQVYETQFAEGNNDTGDTTNYRRVTSISNQKAILLEENNVDPWSEGDPIGIANPGVPSFPYVSKGTIYSHRIRSFIDTQCGLGFADSPTGDSSVCRNENGATGLALFEDLALHVYAHEAAHMSGPLADVTEREYNKYGYHTKTGEGFIMDVSVESKYSKKDGYTTFYIYNDFRDQDYHNVRLVQP